MHAAAAAAAAAFEPCPSHPSVATCTHALQHILYELHLHPSTHHSLYRTRRTAPAVPQAAAAAVAAAAEALEGLDLEGLDLNLDLLSNATKQEQAQVERALSLSQSLGGSRTLSLSNSLKDGGIFGPLSPSLSSKVQQVLLSPQASSQMQQLLLSPRAVGAQPPGGALAAAAAAAALAAAAKAAAANAAAGAGWALDPASEELPMEEMMTADIFGLE